MLFLFFSVCPLSYSEGPAFSTLSSCNPSTHHLLAPITSDLLNDCLPNEYDMKWCPGIKLLQLKQVPNNLLYFVMQSRPILTSVAMATVNHGEMRSGRE